MGGSFSRADHLPRNQHNREREKEPPNQTIEVLIASAATQAEIRVERIEQGATTKPAGEQKIQILATEENRWKTHKNE